MARTLRKRKLAKAYGIKVKVRKLKTGIIKDKYGNLAYKFTCKTAHNTPIGDYAFCDTGRSNWQNERIFKRELKSFIEWRRRINFIKRKHS